MELTAGAIVRRGDEQAARWFHLAAEQGHRDAYIQFGYRYREGIGVPLYLDGRGTEPDTYTAYFFARLAERRLPDGALQALARTRAADAARLLTAAQVENCNAFVDGVIAAGRSL